MSKLFTVFSTLLLGAVAWAATPTPPEVSHQMSLTLQIDGQTLIGVDTLTVMKGTHTFLMSKKCDVGIVNLTAGSKEKYKFVPAVQIVHPETDEETKWYEKAVAVDLSAPAKVVVTWRGVFNDSVSSAQFSREQVAGVPDGVISKQGVFLSTSALFYPLEAEQVQQFEVTVATPAGWVPITTGLRTKVGNSPEGYTRWNFGGPWQIDGLTIAAGEFNVHTTDTLGIQIETCFTNARDSLSNTYLTAAKKYIARYSKAYGTYPWPAFSMVEAFFPAGYGLPGFTFLGSEVIALPFIVSTSLGHEVLHNWWGNGVYVSAAGGNWCEGLTTFGADWAYKADRGEELDYRRGLIKDFSSYVNNGNDFALKTFTSRSSGATRAVGYGKCAFLFYTLKTKLGEEKFNAGLQRFYSQYRYRIGSWANLQESMEQASGADLKPIFKSWLDDKGAPVLSNPRFSMRDNLIEVKCDVTGNLKPESIPLKLSNGDSSRWVSMDVRNGKAFWTSAIESRVYNWKPTEVAFDPDFQIWRQPAVGEIPPSLSDLYGSKVVAVYLAPTGDAALDSAYRKFATSMFDSCVWVTTPDKEPKLPLVTLGKASPEMELMRSLSLMATSFGLGDKFGKYSHVAVGYSGERLTASCFGVNPGAIAILLRKAPHYGKYSYIMFDEAGKNVAKSNWKATDHLLKVSIKM